MVKAIHALALLLLAGTVQAIEIQPAEPAEPTGFIDITTDAVVRGQTRTYVVQMRDEAGLVYEGGLEGFLATAPSDGERYDANASHVQQYTTHLVSSHDSMLATMGASDRKVYSYCHTMNGFAAQLTPAEAAQLKSMDNVVQVWEDYSVDIETNSTSEFLGLTDSTKGLRARGGLKGENIIIGVMDTGAVQEHPSFSDTVDGEVVYKAPPERWTGICQEGEAWSADDCNNKMIGARFYVDGFLAGRGSVVEGEFLSPRDSSGHGSHTASTAGGNEVSADILGTPAGTISGMAPRARLSIYKVCWLSPGATNFSCFFSDSAAATDQAVADGVDVLNFSVGTAASFTDLQDLAFLNATEAGVFVARSGGNDGPGFATINAGEPWVTSVAASTTDGPALTLAAGVNAPESLAGNYAALEGAITQPLSASGDVTADVGAADPIEACTPLANDLTGQIALIARGTCGFVAKVENAVAAGAVGILMYTDAARPKTRMGGTATALTQTIPGVMIDNAPGVALLAEATGGATINASLNNMTFTFEDRTGNVMAGFSSRGPFSTIPGWISPDITAPGVQILAAYAPDQADGSEGGLFDYLSGTSMSGPHIAGLGALIKEGRPEWSPAQIKSAMMTTARQDVFKEDGVTPADPFDFGAGHVVPNDAVSPGLTYDAGTLDYVAASCGTDTPLASPADCSAIASGLGLSLDPENLNLPSIGLNEIPGSKTITRTVTAVSDFNIKKGRKSFSSKKQKFTAVIDAPPGFDVSVSPTKLKLKPGQTATYELTVTNQDAAPGEWAFGALTWENKNSKGNDVRSPIAVNTVAVVAPDFVTGEGPAGSAQFDLTYGYTGEYTAGVHGINNPAGVFSVLGLADDPDDQFTFLDPNARLVILRDTAPGTAFRQWSTYDNYTSGNDDLDLYLYYCPTIQTCTQIATSANGGSDEAVNVTLPIPYDASVDNPYVLFIHAFDTELETANLLYFDQQVGVVNDNGNLTVDAPSNAVSGQTVPVTIEWTDLATGNLAKQIGAISHSDANGIQDLTIIEIDNDPVGSICDFGLCP